MFLLFFFSHGVGFLKYRFVQTLIVFQVWDLRQSPSRCIEALSSSGWPASGNQANTTSTRSLQLPQGMLELFSQSTFKFHIFTFFFRRDAD